MPTRDVTLTEHHEKFIANGIEAGRYGDVDDAIDVALHLLEQEEQKNTRGNEWLRSVTQEAFGALDRGEGIALNSIADLDSFVDGIVSARASKSIAGA